MAGGAEGWPEEAWGQMAACIVRVGKETAREGAKQTSLMPMQMGSHTPVTMEARAGPAHAEIPDASSGGLASIHPTLWPLCVCLAYQAQRP